MLKFRQKNVMTIAAIFLIALATEIFIFNYRFFQEKLSSLPHIIINCSDFTSMENCYVNNSGLSAKEGSYFYVKNPGTEVKSIKLNVSGDTSFTVSVSYTDEAFSETQISGGTWNYSPYVAGSDHIRINTFGKCKYIKFLISKVYGTSVIKSVELNAPYFHFSIARFLLLLVILLIIHSVRHTTLWNCRVIDRKKTALYFLYIIYLSAAFLCTILYLNINELPYSYNLSSSSDIYQLLTEAFFHGKTSLLVSPPQELGKLANPYDSSARNFTYLFDSAYFKGRYYCYFGITPVITLMLPIKFLTGAYISSAFGCYIYFLIMLAAVLFLYYNITFKWFPNIGTVSFLFGASAAVYGSGFFWLIARPLFYELAETCALTYLFLGLGFAIAASRHALRQTILLLLSGLSFALMVASRPTFIFYIAAAIPIVFPFLFKRDKNRLHFKNAAAFCIPLAVFAVVLMLYNVQRFGSPFDFGQKYQLTVSDIRYNKFSNLGLLPIGIYHYFFAPLSVDLTFPFFHVSKLTPESSAGYYFNFPSAGIFNYPLMFILLASSYIIRRIDRQRHRLKLFISLLLIPALFIVCIDILMAGVLERYMLDIAPILIFVSLMLWNILMEYFLRKGAGRPVEKLFCIICLATAVISTLATVLGEFDNQKLLNPILYQNISSLVQFWR